jgi:hypothetical protein
VIITWITWSLTKTPAFWTSARMSGSVSMYLAKTYGCKGASLRTEPNNYKRLVANLKQHGLDRLVTAHNLAVTGDGRDSWLSAKRTQAVTAAATPSTARMA